MADKKEKNFIECETEDEANEVSLKAYVFYGFRKVGGKEVYVFKIRQRK